MIARPVHISITIENKKLKHRLILSFFFISNKSKSHVNNNVSINNNYKSNNNVNSELLFDHWFKQIYHRNVVGWHRPEVHVSKTNGYTADMYGMLSLESTYVKSPLVLLSSSCIHIIIVVAFMVHIDYQT